MENKKKKNIDIYFIKNNLKSEYVTIYGTIKGTNVNMELEKIYNFKKKDKNNNNIDNNEIYIY